MTRRGALAVFAAAALLLAVLNALVYRQYRTEVDAVTGELDDRLAALGGTAARWLATGGADPHTLLATLADENHLEDAYVVDARLRIVAAAHAPADRSLNLLRVDDDRLASALDGHASVGPGYSIDDARVDVAYAPFTQGGARRVLALEAGAAYLAPADRVRTTYLASVALTVLVALVFALGLVLALRAVERARVAHGRAERLAAVGQMAAMVAHEVRNPLGILRGQVELAREKLGDAAPPRERERFVEMLAEIERLNRLTEEFLALARDAPLDLARVDLGALAGDVATAARTASPDAHVEAAAPDAPLVVQGDALKLRQALLNLVLNALQVGGAEVHVRVEAAREDGDRARVTVIDDGPGVPPELAGRLFEPFVSDRPGGSGLGLAVARRIAERHGGTLVLEPAPRGARFTLHLPIHREAPHGKDPDRR